MPNDETDGALHLPDLRIRNFRGIREIDIPRLGRVTLITGKNSVGKTTILEACRVYAERGRMSVLHDLSGDHEEYNVYIDEDGDEMISPNLAAIFHGRGAYPFPHMEIGSRSSYLKVNVNPPKKEDKILFDKMISKYGDESNTVVMERSFHNYKQQTFLSSAKYRNTEILYADMRSLRHQAGESESIPTATCIFLGPGLMNNYEIGTYLDQVTLTEDEDYAVEALRLVLGDDVQRIAMVGDGGNSGPVPRFVGRNPVPRFLRDGRRAVVKLKNLDRPVPLKSLGDGAARFFGVALALANCRDGFLLIDEAENGVHYSVQDNYWRLVFNLARQNNVQVLATTHSWDCVRGFAQAAVEAEDSEGFLFRLERNGDRVWPVPYSEEKLRIAAEQGIEVR